jgi:Ca2+-transporting ATPase
MITNARELGLSSAEVSLKQEQFGQNILPEKPKTSSLILFVSQLKNPLIYILLISGFVTFLIGDYSDAAIIFGTVFINTILGFVQERKASDALYALKHYISDKTIVFRDGERLTIDTKELVPGDMVVLSQGSKVPADGVLMQINRLYVDESILTGESLAISKELNTDIYMGTTVASGQAIMQVKSIGSSTKMGAIALQIQVKEVDTPLQKQIKGFSKQLIYIVSGLVFLVLVIGLLYGLTPRDIFLTSVALAVSSIPEGLIVSLTVVLAIGMQKILRRKALVRKLAAAETLGGVTVICVDKTGTITGGKMEVIQAVGDESALAEQILLANDLDDPIVIAGYEWGQKIIPGYAVEHERLDSIPFSSSDRFFMSLHKWSKSNNKIFVNGAPEVILDWTTLSQKEKSIIQSKIDELTKTGYRLIGLAQKNVSTKKTHLESKDGRSDLVWAGILAFSDPVRSGVKEALERSGSAGIRTIVITGDYARTSEFVLAELGINLTKEQIITGEEVRSLSVSELAKKVSQIRLFARTTPDQKLMIVEALKKNGEVVAMMGDGVNDAPALHAADIGIAVGEATDVAKESADMVLLDSNFSTIVSAIEEGRGIFENIRKIILYLMSDAFTEIIVVLGSIILGFPPALIAVQILWINLGSDGFPSLTLTIDPIRKNIMQESPRPIGEKLVTRWMIILIGVISLTAGLLALGSFAFVYKTTGDIILARSMAFVVLGFDTLVYVFSVRSLMIPFWKTNVFANKWLIMAVTLGFFLQVLPFMSPLLRDFFGVSSLGYLHWLAAIAASVIMFVIVEIFKVVYHPHHIYTESQ